LFAGLGGTAQIGPLRYEGNCSPSKDDSMFMTQNTLKRCSLILAGAAVTAVSLASTTVPATAADGHHGGAAATGYNVRSYSAVGTESGPDDITRLGHFVYVTFQNGVGPLGEPAKTGATASTIQQYALNGTPGKSWQVSGKVDGLTADPAHDRLLLTANEDGNSSLSTLSPDADNPLTQYTYSGLTHGGGTDAITVADGTIIVSASAPTNPAGPAAYSVALTGTTANLTPMFADNASATAANGPHSGTTTALALTDPDSNTLVPAAAPRFNGSLMLDAQGDRQLIFAANPGTGKQTLQVLTVAQPLDDTVFSAHTGQTLWITDPSSNTVDAVTGPFKPGQAISTVAPDTGATSLATLDLASGTLTTITELTAIHPKGLIFTGTSHQDNNGDHGHDSNQPHRVEDQHGNHHQ
jgi:hypothetical protein